MNKSRIMTHSIKAQGEVNGRWVFEVLADEFHPAGTLVCEPAPGEPDDLTFTAPNGKRYWDTEEGSRWTPRV